MKGEITISLRKMDGVWHVDVVGSGDFTPVSLAVAEDAVKVFKEDVMRAIADDVFEAVMDKQLARQ